MKGITKPTSSCSLPTVKNSCWKENANKRSMPGWRRIPRRRRLPRKAQEEEEADDMAYPVSVHRPKKFERVYPEVFRKTRMRSDGYGSCNTLPGLVKPLLLTKESYSCKYFPNWLSFRIASGRQNTVLGRTLDESYYPTNHTNQRKHYHFHDIPYTTTFHPNLFASNIARVFQISRNEIEVTEINGPFWERRQSVGRRWRKLLSFGITDERNRTVRPLLQHPKAVVTYY